MARVFWFSALSVPVALSVLSVADRAAVLASTVINALTILTPLLLFYGPARNWLLAGNDPGAPFAIKLRTALIWVPLSGVLLGTLTPPYLLGLVAAVVVIVVFGVVRRRRMPKQVPENVASQRTDWLLWGLATLIAYFVIQVISPPWLPLEEVKVDHYRKPIVGYVVGESSGHTLVVSRLKFPIWVPTKAIEQRELCLTSTDWWARPLTDNLAQSGMPLCPRLSGVDPIPTPVPTSHTPTPLTTRSAAPVPSPSSSP